ncbi:MAG TPA: hypothetical protein VJO34_03295 [Methylomirabilota bacterium]|nr:hypothetical protein [Methylomirabilota bacterium]
MGVILAQVIEGALVAVVFLLPMFIVFPLTYSFAVELLTLVLSLAALSFYLIKRIAMVDPLPPLLDHFRRAYAVATVRRRILQWFKERTLNSRARIQ